MRVVIIGAGVIGVCAARALAQRGADVTVVESDTPGLGASRGNPGWIAPSHSYPMTDPRLVLAGARGMFSRRGALLVNPTLDLSFYRWAARFLRRSTRAQWERGVHAIDQLNRRTFELLDRYADEGVEFEMYRSGILCVASSGGALAAYEREIDRMIGLGVAVEAERLDPGDVVALEPTLDPEKIAGGIHTGSDRFLRPETLVAGILATLPGLGARMRSHTRMMALRRDGAALIVRTASEDIRADRVVIAAGYRSARFLAALDVRVPLVGAKGWSVLVEESAGPRQAIYLPEHDAGVCPYRGVTRVATGFELGSRRLTVSTRRIDRMLKQVARSFDGWDPRRLPRSVECAGFRPMSSDSLPLIGPTPGDPDIFVATGHCTLGVTLAPATAEALAEWMLNGTRETILEPFDPARAP